MSDNQRNARRVLQGIVSSAKMDKTIAVSVERRYAHPKYGKSVRSHKKYYAHDELNTAAVGDRVEIAATRPLSKLKRWRLVRVVEQNRLAQATSAEGEGLAMDLAGAKRTTGGEDQ